MIELYAVLITGTLAFIVAAMAMTRVTLGETDLLEARRRTRLSQRSWLYREFPYGIAQLQTLIDFWLKKRSDAIQRDLRTLGEDDWQPSEYVAITLLRLSPYMALAILFTWMKWQVPTAATVTIMTIAMAPYLVQKYIQRNARKRIREIRKRLPFSLDLMALVLEAGGGTIDECLRFAVKECHGHPLGVELNRVALALEKGRSVAQAFQEFRDRIGDAEIGEIARDIASAHERGVPLKQSFRDVSARLRSLQVQWQEKASEEAKVHIVWPTMLVMGACLIIVGVPFLLGVEL